MITAVDDLINHSRGLHLRETGNNARAKVLLETAEAKQREAMAKKRGW
jgi:hypothetical protein